MSKRTKNQVPLPSQNTKQTSITHKHHTIGPSTFETQAGTLTGALVGTSSGRVEKESSVWVREPNGDLLHSTYHLVISLYHRVDGAPALRRLDEKDSATSSSELQASTSSSST